MKIQKYKAKITNSEEEVVGYVSEIREYLGSGTYGNGTDYLISVTEKSMLSGLYGTFKISKESISEFYECPVCEINEQKKEYGYTCSNKCFKKL